MPIFRMSALALYLIVEKHRTSYGISVQLQAHIVSASIETSLCIRSPFQSNLPAGSQHRSHRE